MNLQGIETFFQFLWKKHIQKVTLADDPKQESKYHKGKESQFAAG